MPDIQILRAGAGYVEQTSTPEGRASVDLSTEQAFYSFPVAMTTGQIPGMRQIQMQSFNPLISGGTFETVSAIGGIYDPVLVPAPVDIVSSSVNDTLLGTGTQLLLVAGLGSDWLDLVEVVEMDGTISAATVNDFFRINSVFSLVNGALSVNDGDITMSIGGKDVLIMGAKKGQVADSPFSVPNNTVSYVTSLDVAVSKGNTAQPFIGLRYSDDGGLTFNTWRIGPLSDIHETPHLSLWPNVFQLSLGGDYTDIWVEALNTGAGNTSVVSVFAGFTLPV